MSARPVPATTRLRLRARRRWAGLRSGRVAAVAAVAAVAGSVCGLGVLAAGTPAGAAAPSQQGWWAQTSTPAAPVAAPPSPVALPAPAPSSPPSQATAPDVPSDGLLVAGGPTATMPNAYAAVLYDVPTDATDVGPLTLAVAPNSGTAPNAAVQACPLKSPTFHAEQGGPMSDAPAYVTTGCANGTSDGNGNYRFDVRSFVKDGVLAVAIVPVSATDRLVFSKPSQSSLPGTDTASTSSGFTSSGFTPSDSTGSAPGPLSAGTGSFSSGSFPAGAGAVTAPAATATPAVAAPPKANQPTTVSAAPAASVAVPTDGNGKASAVAVAVTVTVVVLLCGLWLFAGRASVDAVTTAAAAQGGTS